jgi:hypothetical protein
MAYAVRQDDGTVTIDGRPLDVGEKVFRWWDSGAFGASLQVLTVIRVNPKTVTVETKYGSQFRMLAGDIAGRYIEEG